MDEWRDFYTLRGYTLHSEGHGNGLSPGMEDYLEMICRLMSEERYARVLELANALHVKPSSASNMVQRLAKEGLLDYERYGVISLTAKGREVGRRLLQRHEILEKFLGLIGLGNVLEDAEKVEHNISGEATAAIGHLVDFFMANDRCRRAWERYLRDAGQSIRSKPPAVP